MRLDAYVVLTLKQEGGAVCAIGKTGGWKYKSESLKKKNTHTQSCTGTADLLLTLTARCLICKVQTVRVSITFEAFSDAVTTATLEVTRVARP